MARLPTFLMGGYFGAGTVLFVVLLNWPAPGRASASGPAPTQATTPAALAADPVPAVAAPAAAGHRASPVPAPAAGSTAPSVATQAAPLPVPAGVDDAVVAAPVPSACEPLTTLAPPPLRIPVEGIAANALSDTFSDARGSGRRHDAIDIMAARGTPVLAVADGRVVKLFDSQAGGLTLYQFDDSGHYGYYYAHLDAYAAGMAEGLAVKRGDVIGLVGSTGNASPDGPHLHFAVTLLCAERRWWQGRAINPYPLFTP